MIKRFKKYKAFACIEINEKPYALVQIGIGSFVLLDEDGELLNNGYGGNNTNYLTYKEMVTLARTKDFKFLGYLVFSPMFMPISSKIFRMLRKEDDVTKLKEGLKWALTEMRNLGVTESQETVYTKMEKLLK